MRTIKFRAWGANSAKRTDEPSMVQGWEDSVWFGYYGFDGLDHFEIMQFTGLTDKNGVDIYESDLMKVYHNGKPAIGVGEVVFSHGYVGGWVLTTDYNDSLNIGTRTKDVEVIGNIHENPELLK